MKAMFKVPLPPTLVSLRYLHVELVRQTIAKAVFHAGPEEPEESSRQTAACRVTSVLVACVDYCVVVYGVGS
jgi:hypothetical protein